MKWNPSRHPEVDKDLISEPHRWPMPPYLPLKRFSTDPGTGETTAQHGIIYKTQLTSVYMTDRGGALTKGLTRHVAITYRTIDDMIADGWEVD